jgi:hypothetical protein
MIGSVAALSPASASLAAAGALCRNVWNKLRAGRKARAPAG